MERLTYNLLDQNGNKTDSVVYESRAFKESISTMPEREQERILLQRLAYYEDLEEQGRLIVLPCKVGDTVYTFYNGKNCKWPTNMKRRKIYETLVSGIRLHDWDADDWSALLFLDTKEMTGDYEFSFDEFGKTIFQTRAEAEAALKGVSEDANN